MSRYIERYMQTDEEVLYTAQLHWVIYRAGIILTPLGGLLGQYGDKLIRVLIGAGVADLLATPIKFLASFIVLAGALHLIFSYIRQISTELVITNQRVIAKYGFIATTTFEVMLAKVEGANIDQTVLGRLLGYGTVMVRGTGGGISPIDHVADPARFHAALMEILRRHGAHGAAAPAPDAGNDD